MFLAGQCGKRLNLIHMLPMQLLICLRVDLQLSVIVLSLTLSTLYVGSRPNCEGFQGNSKGAFCWLGNPSDNGGYSSSPSDAPCRLVIATSAIGFISSLLLAAIILIGANSGDDEDDECFTRVFPGIISFPNACLWFSTLVYIATQRANDDAKSAPSDVASTAVAVLVFAGFNFLIWVLLQKASFWKFV